jgi:hypothetical protein
MARKPPQKALRCPSCGQPIVEFLDCGCSFSEGEIEEVRPILETLESIEKSG